MKKFKEYLMISIFALVILLLNKNSAMSNEKTSAIVGHVITQAIQGNDMNHTEVFTNELNALMHKFSLDMLDIFLEHMPNILDSVQKELKLEADKRYKCSLQDDDYKNKECI
jgi:hypothetical protein|tara:strand:+ start:148 stop:483 length:336 start_codon:yes stop_codon:yes gene_type:complete